VAGRAEEPRWVDRLVVEAVHLDLIREHGGMPGLRDEHALEAALARAQQRFAYEPTVDLADLAATYAHGLARSHPFNDGNKRIAFVTMAVFLGLNGFEIDAPETEVVTVMLALAAGQPNEEEFAVWIRSRLSPTATPPSQTTV
jgi:death-on-curing protein